MTVFEQLIADLAAQSGLPFEVDQNGCCALECNDLIITLQYRSEFNDILLSAVVSDPEKITVINEAVMRYALSLAFNGQGTDGNYLGLSEDELVLTNTVGADNLDALQLGEIIFVFKEAAVAVRDTLADMFEEDALLKERGLGAQTLKGNDEMQYVNMSV